MFYQLGFINAWRNLTRSLLAIISMAFAAAFLAYLLTLGRGYSQGAGQPLRQMLGGEITIYRQKLISEQPGSKQDWQFRLEALSPLTDLNFFYSKYEQSGYMANNPMDETAWKSIAAALRQNQSITGVYPVHRLPIYSQYQSEHGVRETVANSLYGKDLSQETSEERSLAGMINSGRWLQETDDGSFAAVVASNQLLPSGVKPLTTGDTLKIEIPQVVQGEQGLRFNWQSTTSVELKVIGTVALHTRDVDFFTMGELKTEQIHGYHNDIYLPLATWQAIWQQAAGTLAYLPEQYILQVDDLTYLEDVVYSLREQLPNIQINSVPTLNDWMLNQFLLEPQQAFSRIPPARLAALKETKSNDSQGVIAADLRLPIVALVMFNAALLLCANILILIIERKREMAVLKSIGARRRDITQMIVTEAMTITFLGASSGYLMISIPSVLNQLSNLANASQILGSLLLNYLLVLLITCGSAAIFALIPGLQIASKSVMEVLRDE
ncbi:MAG: ABC transporter permease [Negativicutes bacterium]|nr:ABC transporter permease [Negativicutes bacterium]